MDKQMLLLLIFQIVGEMVGEVRPVADMHQRKAEMARHSDAFIALPGERSSVPCLACIASLPFHLLSCQSARAPKFMAL